MATVEKQIESEIESNALGVLDCFANGMDDVIYQMAERIAVQRNPSANGILIEVRDIESAVKHFVDIMNKSDMPENAKKAVGTMLDCCSERIRQVK